MDYLYKIWYKDSAYAQQQYHRNMEDTTTVMLPFNIHPLECEQVYPLYYRPTNELMLAMEAIYQMDQRIRAVADSLPTMAKRDFINTLVVEELFTSNEIEQVKSTRQEIAHSVRSLQQNQQTTKHRFHSMAYSYLSLFEDAVACPKTVEDIRKIYDQITDGEVAAENLPDGRCFRKGPEVVETSTGRVIHRGIMPETQIHTWIEALLHFMELDQVPSLIKIAVAHYVFGYVHPFYDGNGRTGRFLSSLYLSKICSKYTAYSIAQGCRLQQKQYYEIFERTNRFNSFGEMNAFIDGFLGLILAGQEKLYENLQDRVAAFTYATKHLQMDEGIAGDAVKYELMCMLEQKRLFDEYGLGLARDDLEQALKERLGKLSHAAMVRCLKALEAEGYIQCTCKRPLTYQSVIGH